MFYFLIWSAMLQVLLGEFPELLEIGFLFYYIPFAFIFWRMTHSPSCFCNSSVLVSSSLSLSLSLSHTHTHTHTHTHSQSCFCNSSVLVVSSIYDLSLSLYLSISFSLYLSISLSLSHVNVWKRIRGGCANCA